MRVERVAVAASMIALAALVAGCSGARARAGVASTTRYPTRSSPASTAARPPGPRKPPPVTMVRWHGPVEELFVHPLVIEPRLAFTSDTLGVGFQDYFVTALEFRRILDSLWHKGWTLVDVHRAAAGTVRVPVGRKPLVLSEDDVNYYRYFRGRGLATRLVLAGNRVLAQLPSGRLTDEDVVPLVEEEIARHPAFSADGARGVLGVTGYEGLFGEHHPNRPAARARLAALARWLTVHGWTIASHTWGHVNLSASSPSSIAWDTRHWQAEAVPILGATDVLIYPFGALPTDSGIRQLASAGFKIQLDIDVTARSEHRDGAIIMSRRHVDGYAFATPDQQRQFYDVAAVRDRNRPPFPS
jgi:hypothetical protein